MKIEENRISIEDLVNRYEDNADNGVIGYGGKLDIRPPYQREFVYKDKERNAVIDSALKDFPLNTIYWAKNNDRYEVLDGQQRIISICQYVNNDFSFNNLLFSGLPEDKKQKILNYKLSVYICEGNESEKLEWFKIINIAGVKLTEQELRNAVYTGTWLSNAKSIFSKNNCIAKGLGEKYINGSPIRQEYLETALKWISDNKIEQYMGEHQQDKDADELWQYFQDVISWVKKIFSNYRKEMKGLEWGYFYNHYKDNKYNANNLEQKIVKYMVDDEVGNKKGIYEYLLSDDPKYLNLRIFTENQKREHFEKHKIKGVSKDKQNKDVCICIKCGKEIELDECEADHIIAWSKGGKTDKDNLQFLCKKCNGEKSNN
jgi:hypothetical protein